MTSGEHLVVNDFEKRIQSRLDTFHYEGGRQRGLDRCGFGSATYATIALFKGGEDSMPSSGWAKIFTRCQ